MVLTMRRFFRLLISLAVILLPALAPAGCTCDAETPPPPVLQVGRIPCQPRGASGTAFPPLAPEAKTTTPGTISGALSITSSGSLAYGIQLEPVPGRGPVPQLGVAYDSSAGGGILGAGFSLTGAASIIARCPQNLNQDGEIRDVRYDAADPLCLDGSRLISADEAPGLVEYRLRPDAHVKVIGHFPSDAQEKTPNNALYFEAFMPSGLVIEYGKGGEGKPLALGGVPRAFLATKARDGRGNAMSYSYCFAEAEGYTAEYALTEIRYSSFEGTPALEASRAVRLVYGTKDPADTRISFDRGMALQSSLRLEEVQMIGPESSLVRRYGFSYAQSPTTKRTLLTSVEECGGDGACKPPTRFSYKSTTPGFERIKTPIATPTSELSSPMLYDVTGDGLEDLVIPDTHPALSTATTPITQWFVAKNLGKSASPHYFDAPKLVFSQEWDFVADPSEPSDSARIQPELGTVLDYDNNGFPDILVHDVYGSLVNETVLLAQEGPTFTVHDTGIRRPFPLAAPPPPPELRTPGASVHLLDLDGDSVLDRLVCEDHDVDPLAVPGAPAWRAHLWRPAQGGKPAGFDPEGEALGDLDTYFACNVHMYTVDLNSDGKMEIIVPDVQKVDAEAGAEKVTYKALSRRSDGRYEAWDTHLPIRNAGGRVLFLDITGDRLPDALIDGSPDHRLLTYMNTDGSFAAAPGETLPWDGVGAQDAFFRLGVPLDFNGDSRSDLLVPIAGGVWPNVESSFPRWYVLEATGALDGAVFRAIDVKIPVEAQIAEAITLADPRAPRVGDVNGDGAADVVLLLDGVFNVFENLAPDQDVLVSISDGMNVREPDEPGFVPSVSVSYMHLVDEWITNGAKANDPALSTYHYRSRADAANDCSYPRHCALGPQRVVSEYAISDGEGGQRRFAVRYEDGRYHRLVGSLGFAKRIITDLDTGAGVLDLYDNRTSFEIGGALVFPFTGQATKQWRWYPGLPTQANADQVELVFVDTTPTFVPTNDDKTYFTLPTMQRVRSFQGTYPSPVNPAQSIDSYVAEIEAKGGATLLSDTTTTVSEFDAFGNVRIIDVVTAGVDLTLHIDRNFKNDTERWVLGQLETERACSSASMISQCRMLTRTSTPYGEVRTETRETEDQSQQTKLLVELKRDPRGNVTDIITDDAFGHHRVFHTDYDAEDVFPVSHTNAAGHISFVEYDAGLGLITKHTDPNQLVTEWTYDSHGRLELVERPDGTTTSVTLSRTKDGGPTKDAWRVTQRTTTSGGADDTAELDSLGRPSRLLFHGPDPVEEAGSPPRLMQVMGYDRLSGKLARRSVPVSEFTPEAQLLFDEYEFDSLGREVLHRAPWSATTQTTYKGLTVEVLDALLNLTIAEHDALGRPVKVTDAKKATTSYTYGPFDTLYTVTAPGNAITRTTRDALGRVWKLEQPNRGTTINVHNGYGELESSTDALGRVVTFAYDALGRTESRTDKKGAEILTTTWTWDTAANGIGRLHKLTSPDGEKTFGLNAKGQIESLSLAVMGEAEVFSAGVTYHPSGLVATMAYPSPNGAAPFVVAQDFDVHGHMIAVRDSATGDPYWSLTKVDNAGRFQKESFGNGATTERTYYSDKQAVKSIFTQVSGSTKQNLGFEYDALLNLSSRTDSSQPLHTRERFRHDALSRLTCAYFSAPQNPLAPCAQSFDYSPNGNLIYKSDVGVLSYTDAKHPHAVTNAGGGGFAYDAVGNQITRPGGMAITYTPFDLPKTITQGPSTFTFGYGGDQARIRKTTPAEETIYFGDLYERVTEMGSSETVHRFHVHSPERVVAVVTRGGADPGTRYLHVDHLGSVNVLTTDQGTAVDRRSYDAYGQRRNPIWGQPLPPSWSSKTTKGFTGHEDDEELGLVNMRGRLMDPKLGRFITTDPVVSNRWNGQTWNAYSYVRNNPLTYIDPSGFTEDRSRPPQLLPGPDIRIGPDGRQEIWITGPPRRTVSTEIAVGVGAAAAPADVDTTGGSSVDMPQGLILVPNENLPGVGLHDDCMPTIGQGQPETAWDRVLSLKEPPDEIGVYAIAYAIKHDFIVPIGRWIADEPQTYLDADHNLRSSSVHRDYSAEMAPVLGNVVLILAPGANALARGEGLAAREAPGAYSVAFEANLTPRAPGTPLLSKPDLYRAHFVEANTQLLKAMSNPELASALRGTLGQGFEATILSPSGRVLGVSPGGWTWHHSVEPGVLQLVPRSQHVTGSVWQPLLHPGSEGGMALWGPKF